MEGSASRAEPSTLKPETVEGSIPQGRTLHENTAHHGRFNVQSGTIHAEARNRGRFHFPTPFPIPQTHSPGSSPRPEPLRCLIRSRQFNMPVGMELTTSSARQDTDPLGRILPDKKPATPATFVTSAPAGAMDNPALPGHYPALPRALQMNMQWYSSRIFTKFAVPDDYHTKLQL